MECIAKAGRVWYNMSVPACFPGMRKDKEEMYMAFCHNCGNELHDEAVICPKCGVEQRKAVAANDTGSFGWGLLGFCVPLAGLILFLVWKDTQPRNAKKAGVGALVSVIIGVVLYVVLCVAMGVLVGASGYYY